MMQSKLFVDNLTLEEVIPVLQKIQGKEAENYTTIEICLMHDFARIIGEGTQLQPTMGFVHDDIIALAWSAIRVYESNNVKNGYTVENM